jgi:CRISPR/Cas system CSM-associated protein Csm3 (group 7 of RAMP superfamily)
MARKLHTLYQADGTLVAQTALHVGGASADLIGDMPLARNGKGELYIPGTSLAGPMRAWWAACYGSKSADIFFGRTPSKGSEDEGHASLITIADGQVTGTATEIRDGIKIDAETGAVEDTLKFDREVLPCGTVIGLSIRFEETAAAQKENAKVKFATLLKALSEGQIRFGAAKTRGLGVAKAELTATSVAMNSSADILSLLAFKAKVNTASSAIAFDFAGHSESMTPDNTINIIINWTSVLPVFNLGNDGGGAIDHLPLLSGAGATKAPVLTGASIKGALRSHAARICRTVFGGTANGQHELVEALFGVAGKKANPKDKRKTKPGMGAVSVSDCVTEPSVLTEEWTAVLGAGGGNEEKSTNAQARLDAANHLRENGWQVHDHVAIDRWTGGAKEGALYNLIKPGKGQHGRFNISVDYTRLAFGGEPTEQKTGAALGLLLLVLRDLTAGKIAFGFGAMRGNGALDIDKITFENAGAKFVKAGLKDQIFDKGIGAEHLAGFSELANHWKAEAAK